MSSPPAAATRPAVIRRESPGRKKPMRSPVSVNTIAVSGDVPAPPHQLVKRRRVGQGLQELLEHRRRPVSAPGCRSASRRTTARRRPPRRRRRPPRAPG